MRRPILVAMATVALASGCGGGSAGEEESGPGIPAELLERLREGGSTVVFRHAATDSSVDMTDDLKDCTRQRNLNADGRDESREIGRAFERLDIRVGRVLASPFCRARDTARLAFGRARTSRRLLAAEFFDSPAEARREGLPRLLSTRPRRGTTTVLVTHGSAIDGATGVNPDEGGAVVVAASRRPPGFEVLGTVAVDAWAGATGAG